MANMYENCYECGKKCVEAAFCSEGASLDKNQTDGISLPRNIKVKIVANSQFWGFGGTLIEGWARYENGYFDFFDGFEEDHYATKTCGPVTYGPFKNEQRPDVFYRSVYDPDLETKHYGVDGTEDGIERGGAEVYLVDRGKGLVSAVTGDSESCDKEDPTKIFKKFPENFGFGTKISFNDSIYKNVTGAWRLTVIPSPSSIFYAKECDGTLKENIIKGEFSLFEEKDKYVFHNDGDCLPDGAVPKVYSGSIIGNGTIYRNSGQEGFISAKLSYGAVGASGIVVGDQIFLDGGSSYDGAYYVSSIFHTSAYSTVDLAGTWGSGEINVYNSGKWYISNTFDEQTCCGKAAYGVDPKTKRQPLEQNYHSDFGKVFNNNKNIIQSNRFPENRETWQYGNISPIRTGPRFDNSYPSVNYSGQILMSGGYPVFDRDMPYYGPFHEIDKIDNTRRNDTKYNTITGRNLTCYTKKATLDIFPDCISQHVQYDECETMSEKYLINRLKRLVFVYRGFNFHDTCEFDGSGRPITWSDQSPSNIDDLKNALAGQEIYMYLNLNQAFGGQIVKPPCDCSEDPPIGNQPPEMVKIGSPVTFPCMPKFDLYPEAYGCKDARFQIERYKQFVSTTFPNGPCDPFPSSVYTCMVRQPYTTYGFMRSLCGKKTSDRKNIITSAFSQLTQTGSYRNTTPIESGNIDEPMYWEYTNPGPQPPIFNAGDWNGDATAGVSSGGKYPYWGLSDINGRLIAPYYAAKQGRLEPCPGDVIDNYVDFSPSGIFFNGWPTEHVPFLIEIDHEDFCAGCATIGMDERDLVATLDGLGTDYSHNQEYNSTAGGKYGYNNCRYNHQAALDPGYSCASGTALSFCSPTGDNFYQTYGTPYAGNTCACINGTDIPMKVKKIKDSNLILGWISDNGNNGTFVNLEGCKNSVSDLLNDDYLSGAAGGYSVYASLRLACPQNLQFLHEPSFPRSFYESSPVSSLWGCNTGSCNYPYPAAGSNLSLDARFFLIADARRSDFEALREEDLIGPYASDILENGIKVGLPGDGYSNLTLCSGEKIYAYGCAVNGSFYPCQTCAPISTCVSCSGYGLDCNNCEQVIGMNGYPTRRAPANFELNECKCDCKDPSLMRIYTIDGSGNLVLESSQEPYGCNGTIYWVAVSGVNRGFVGPWLRNQSSPFAKMGIGPYQITAKDFCSFHQGVNAIASGIKYKILEPYKDTCGQLKPNTCEEENCEDPRARSSICGDPIPYYDGEGFTVYKKACYPEIMIVSKAECGYGEGSNKFKLTVSREYHHHDRTWYKSYMQGGLLVCEPIQTGAYTYDGTKCHKTLWSSLTDTVTPAYEGKCSVHHSTGTYANQDYLYNNKPISSGDTLWNYYNLYEITSAYYLPSVDNVCNIAAIEVSGYVFSSGELTNKKYSCIQDIKECGSELFCNKMFFPRRSYKKNTKITAFGALQICTENAKLSFPDYYTGYQDFSGNDIIYETINSRFIDPCKGNTTVLLEEDIGINDTQLIVDDYLPLIGISNTHWKNTSDIKACIVPISGECNGITMPYSLPNSAIDIMYKGPLDFISNSRTSMGYYFDETVKESDNCLFNQFKILVDVECCTDIIRSKDDELGNPTMLNFVLTDVPSSMCSGIISDPACSCSQSTCNSLIDNPGICIPYYIISYSYDTIICDGQECVLTSSISSIGKKVFSYGNSIFTQSSINCEATSNCGSSSQSSKTFYTHPCYPAKQLEIVGPYYTRVWICDDTGYTKYPTTDYNNPECCNIGNTTLCGSLSSGRKFSISSNCLSIDDMAISSDNVSDTNGDWKVKCNCTFKKGQDNSCGENSIIKVSITEAMPL